MFLKKSLGRQIVCVLTAISAMVMVAIISLNDRFQTSLMVNELSRKNEEMILAVTAGIKYPMSQGHNEVIHRQMQDIKQNVKDLELFICDDKGKVVFSTEPAAIEKPVRDFLHSPATVAALEESIRSGADSPREYEERDDSGRHLSHIHVIRNSPECHRCHDARNRVIGAAVTRMSTDHEYEDIARLRNAQLLISMFGIGSIVAIVFFLLHGLVMKPIRTLANELEELPEKISLGAEVTVIDEDRIDEIGLLQKAFTQMAWELDKITHAMEKSNAELQHANQELESFAYSVSHDLRAPLRNIDGFSKILLDEYHDSLEDRAKHYLNRVRNGTAKMSMLIDDILMFSRIGRAEMQFRVVPCSEIVRNVLEYYAADIDKRGVRVEIGSLPALNCDQTLAQSLFSNLISNALKYTRNVPDPVIRIGFDPAAHAVFIRDNGIGFEMKYHDKIFQVFQRLHLPEEYEGTGIGLAIVKRIAERHHWRVTAQSEPDRGTTFMIEIPELKEGS